MITAKRKKTQSIEIKIPVRINKIFFALPVRFIIININIRFLSFLKNYDKIFRILYIILIKKKKININKSQVQINQESEINIMFTVITEILKLKLRSLAELKFVKLIIKTVNFRKTPFFY